MNRPRVAIIVRVSEAEGNKKFGFNTQEHKNKVP